MAGLELRRLHGSLMGKSNNLDNRYVCFGVAREMEMLSLEEW